ncbi:MAG: GntR family transcriptional regulator [Arhodomonas sp.]|nr:GntR family transcriptional regulator [Arhodomonas sp.]
MREALLQLEGEGLVTLSAHKGYTVTKLSLDEIRELFDLRALIEVDLLQRAIPRLQEHHIARAREVLATFDEMLERGTQERDWGQLNWELHAVLYEPANRPRALAIVRNLHRNADRYLRLQLKLTSQTNERARAEHNRLVELCAAHDVVEASRLLNEHILAARDDLLAFLAERRGGHSQE